MSATEAKTNGHSPAVDDLLAVREQTTTADKDHFNRLLRMQFIKTMETTTLATISATLEAIKAIGDKQPEAAFKLLQRCADNTTRLLQMATGGGGPDGPADFPLELGAQRPKSLSRSNADHG
jgi:hypothetical protein